MWNLKYSTNELIYRTETDSKETDLGWPGGGGGGVGWMGILGFVDADYDIYNG